MWNYLWEALHNGLAACLCFVFQSRMLLIVFLTVCTAKKATRLFFNQAYPVFFDVWVGVRIEIQWYSKFGQGFGGMVVALCRN